jgi:hypothetical protein
VVNLKLCNGGARCSMPTMITIFLWACLLAKIKPFSTPSCSCFLQESSLSGTATPMHLHAKDYIPVVLLRIFPCGHLNETTNERSVDGEQWVYLGLVGATTEMSFDPAFGDERSVGKAIWV